MTKKLLLVLTVCMLTYQLQAQTQQVLYGMTTMGGNQGAGVIFQYNFATNTFTKRYDIFGGTPEGGTPTGSLVRATNGTLYGMVSNGGMWSCGVLFSFNPTTANYSDLFSFDCGSNGGFPYGSPMQSTDGKLYAMTSNPSDYGNIIQFDISASSISGGYNFIDIDGSTPFGDLIQGTNGKLFGMTVMGALGYGVIFQYDPTNTSTPLTVLYQFDFFNDGGNPYGSLLQASDGKFYGLTSSGGANSVGTLFQYDLGTDTYTVKYDFDGAANGGSPYGSLIQGTDGMLYGLTSNGGANNAGVLFQYNPTTSTYNKKFDFGGTDGSAPQGTLKQASDGNLYGLTYSGGANSAGVLFQYNPTTSVYTKKFDFDGANSGSYPQYTRLIELTVPLGIDENELEVVSIAPNPFSSQTVLQTENALNDATLTVTNCFGQTVAEIKNISGQQITFSRNNLASGLYFAELTQDNKIIAKTKLVIVD